MEFGGDFMEKVILYIHGKMEVIWKLNSTRKIVLALIWLG